MSTLTHRYFKALVSGTIAGITTTLAQFACAKAEQVSAVAPLNAVSHIVWGDQAAGQNKPSLKYTGTGLLLNQGATVFWASLYERWFGSDAEAGEVGKAMMGGVAVAGLAYLTDYHLIPKRLTPGFEKRLSGRSLAAVFTAMALSLPLRGLGQGSRR
ncbi:MAG: hypothetical protein PHG36_10900 [Dehalococcoidia bacterium]|nr:hypothetical protein [Dehalococcoidia bacterium]